MIKDILSFHLDGTGKAVAIPPAEAARFVRHEGGTDFVWLHMRREHPETPGLLAACGLDPMAVDALTAQETRPRCSVVGTGVLLNLRGVNLNPGAEPEDMVSVRIWADAARIVTLTRRPRAAF